MGRACFSSQPQGRRAWERVGIIKATHVEADAILNTTARFWRKLCHHVWHNSSGRMAERTSKGCSDTVPFDGCYLSV